MELSVKLTGKRTANIFERSVVRIPLYEKLDIIKIDTSDKSAEAVAEEIMDINDYITEFC